MTKNHRPAVIITSVCPGPVETEIARNVEHGMMLRILISMGFKGFAKSPDYGARVYIRGALAKAEDHVSRVGRNEGLDSFVC